MDKLISHNQLTYLKGRLLVYGNMTINEVIDLARRTGKSCLIFKVAFEKAYN